MAEQKKETITIQKSSLWKYSAFALLGILIIGAFFVFTGDKSITGNVVNNPNPNPSPAGGKVEVSIDDDPILGNKNAKVTIVEFSDYQCPFCRKLWTESIQQIKKDYIDTGKASLVYRDFPLSFHEMAEPSAQAANCVREQGNDEAYYKMHDKIFQEQNKLDGGDPNKGPVLSTVQYTADDLKKWALDIGYNIDGCLDSGKYADEITKDTQDGASYGVQGTPAVFVNGKLISGAQPYANFKAAIDAELK